MSAEQVWNRPFIRYQNYKGEAVSRCADKETKYDFNFDYLGSLMSNFENDPPSGS